MYIYVHWNKCYHTYEVMEWQKIHRVAEKASLKYAKEKLKRVPLDLKKEEYERLSAAAKSADMSINGFIKAAISEKSPTTRGGSDAALCFKLVQII